MKQEHKSEAANILRYWYPPKESGEDAIVTFDESNLQLNKLEQKQQKVFKNSISEEVLIESILLNLTISETRNKK